VEASIFFGKAKDRLLFFNIQGLKSSISKN